MPKGQIRKALSGFYYVYDQGVTYQTRGRGNFRKRKMTPLVGDEVLYESTNTTDGYVLDLLPRKNELVRPPVANVDQGVIIMSAVEPNFSVNLLNRFLVTLAYHKIDPIIYVTKMDLLTPDLFNKIKAYQKDYETIGYQMIVPSIEDNQEAIKKIEASFAEKLTVFMGQSGAGKSTLLNQISPDLALQTGEISTALGRGKHTTRHVELLPLYDGLVADTPGFSSIEFSTIEAAELPHLFPEFVAVADQCKYRGCMHRNEPQCEVKKQVEAGTIPTYRYENYLQFLTEIEERKPKYDKK